MKTMKSNWQLNNRATAVCNHIAYLVNSSIINPLFKGQSGTMKSKL